MIELVQLTKRYGHTLAVDDVSLTVASGEVFGFLGPNGAGKTTTIRMMMGLLQPSHGVVRLGGYDLAVDPIAAKQLCGFVPDRPHVYEKLTGLEFLDFVAGLYHVDPAVGASRRGELLEMFDLEDWATELIETYSHGMKQRLVMAAALIHAPRLLIVDEPMVGLDPRGARLLQRTFGELAHEGVTVFMSTHSLGVAEETCDRIGIIHQGRLIAVGTVDELRRLAGSHADARLEADFPAPDVWRGRCRPAGRVTRLRQSRDDQQRGDRGRRRRVRGDAGRCPGAGGGGGAHPGRTLGRTLALLLSPRFRAARNRVRGLDRRGRLLVGLLAVLGVAFWVGVFVFFYRALRYFLSVPGSGRS